MPPPRWVLFSFEFEGFCPLQPSVCFLLMFGHCDSDAPRVPSGVGTETPQAPTSQGQGGSGCVEVPREMLIHFVFAVYTCVIYIHLKAQLRSLHLNGDFKRSCERNF